MSVKAITSKAEFDELINSGKIVFIDFYTDWCGPCKQISPIFEKLAQEHAQENAEYYKLNIDNVRDVAQELGIRSIPTFYVFKDGNKVDSTVGANPQALKTLVTNGLTRV